MEGFGNSLQLKKIVGIFLALVPEMEHFFFNQNHSDDLDCDASMRPKEMLSKEDKQGLDSAKPLL